MMVEGHGSPVLSVRMARALGITAGRTTRRCSARTISWSIWGSGQSCVCCWAGCVLLGVMCQHLSGDLALLPWVDFCGLLWHRSSEVVAAASIYSTPYCGLGSCLGNGNSHALGTFRDRTERASWCMEDAEEVTVTQGSELCMAFFLGHLEHLAMGLQELAL